MAEPGSKPKAKAAGGKPAEAKSSETPGVPPAPPAESEPASEPPAELIEKPVATNDEEPVFTHERLIQRCARTIGHPAHVIAGALAGVEQGTLSINAVKKLCDEWVSKDQEGQE